MGLTQPRDDYTSLSTLHWRANSEPHRFSIEAVGGSTWIAGRIWTAPAALESLETSSQSVHVIIGVDGTASYKIGGATYQLGSRECLVLWGDAAVQCENTGQWARCEWIIDSPAFQAKHLRGQIGRPFALTADYYALLTTVTNVISTENGFSQPSHQGPLSDVLAGIVIGAMTASRTMWDQLPPAASDALRTAYAVIEARYADPDFDVTALADAIHLSLRQLYRLYAKDRTTPRAAIEARRLQTATGLLRGGEGSSPSAFEEAATLSGFTSGRRLAAALRRSGRGRRPSRTTAADPVERTAPN